MNLVVFLRLNLIIIYLINSFVIKWVRLNLQETAFAVLLPIIQQSGPVIWTPLVFISKLCKEIIASQSSPILYHQILELRYSHLQLNLRLEGLLNQL
jgi:hypothetical protein